MTTSLYVLLADKSTKRRKHETSEDPLQEKSTSAGRHIKGKNGNKAGKKKVQSKEEEDRTISNGSNDRSKVKQRKRKVKPSRSQEGIVYTEEEEESEHTAASNRTSKRQKKVTNAPKSTKAVTSHPQGVRKSTQRVQKGAENEQKGAKVQKDTHDDETKEPGDEISHDGGDGECNSVSSDESGCAFDNWDDDGDEGPDAFEGNSSELSNNKDQIRELKKEQDVSENEESKEKLMIDNGKTVKMEDDMDARKKDSSIESTLTTSNNDVNNVKQEIEASETSHKLNEDKDDDIECEVVVLPKLKRKLWNKKEPKTHGKAHSAPVSSANSQGEWKVKIRCSVNDVQDNKSQDQCDKTQGPGGRSRGIVKDIDQVKEEEIKAIDYEDDVEDQDQNDEIEVKDEDMERDEDENGSSKDIPKEKIHLNLNEWEKFDISSGSKQCPVCNKTFAQKLNLTRHLRTHLTPSARPFQCDKCDSGFIRKTELDKHLAMHERNAVRMYKCPKCREAFASKKTLEQHREGSCSGARRKKKPYKCEGCKKSYATEDILVNHHCKTKRYPQCEKCGERFTLRQKLEEHSTKHKSDDPIQCFVCQSECSSTEEVITHVDIHTRNGKQPFVCNLCRMSYRKEASLLKHNCQPRSDPLKKQSYPRVKNEETSYRCQTCDKVLFSYRGYEHHMRTHTGEKPYMCTICGRRFAWKKGLQDHEASHSDERPFKCEICDASFKTLQVLNSHMVIHSERTSWRYQCDTCGKFFPRIGCLKSHVQRHKPEKDHKCTECPKTFPTTHALFLHKKTHTLEKPHVCELCGRGFRQTQHLKTHMLTHTGEKQFSCEYCFKGFARAGDLRVHVRTHTGEKPYVCECGRAYAQPGGLLSHCRSTGHAKVAPATQSSN